MNKIVLVLPREIYQYGEHTYAYVCLRACVSLRTHKLEGECIICKYWLLRSQRLASLKPLEFQVWGSQQVETQERPS